MRSKPHRLAENISSEKNPITTLNDYFDKIYCINLDRRTDRWKETRVEFKKLIKIMLEYDYEISEKELNE